MALMTFLKAQWDRSAAVTFVVAGSVVLLLGWIGVSQTGYLAEQLPYLLSGGLFGVFLIAVGGLLWLSADLRDEWQELRAIRLLLDRDAAEPLP